MAATGTDTTDLLCPPSARHAATQLQVFIQYCEQRTGLKFADYSSFETFAISQYRRFWVLFLDWSQIICEGQRQPICTSDDCETAIFFPSLRLNYAENLLHAAGALTACHADGSADVMAPSELCAKVIRLAKFLRQLGVQPGDRVAAIARNNTEVVIAALASAAIGAVFSSCAHDMGVMTVLARFQRLEPKILVANCARHPWDAGTSLAERIEAIVAGLPSLAALVTLDDTPAVQVSVHAFAEVVAGGSTEFVWPRFAFNHPLFILFSSGTTGVPKCIVHGAGGTLLEHVKEHRLHGDLSERDRMFFQTSCGWMMWNWQLSALACGADVVVYDGPLKGPETLWQIVADRQATVFGTNPAYVQFTETAGYDPCTLNLSALRSVLSTGSILYPRQFDWIVEHVKPIPVQSISGGTDILGCFVLGNPLLPVYRGQAQCRSLGLDVRSLPEGEIIGELICANPFPSRPTAFYGETSTRYHDAYFAQNPGVWTHGDLIEITPHGVAVHGRSDGVLNIRGVRIGPAEIYRILQQVPTIVEAMAVEQADENEAGGARLILLVVLRAGVALDTALIVRIRTILSEQGHAMMVPAAIIQMNELPVTHSGKRSEAAARDAVNRLPIRNRAALLNPDCLDDLYSKAAAPERDDTAISDDDLERELCKICQRHLNIPEIKPAENYLGLGGDSITILGFLMDAIQRTKTLCPLHVLIGASTITELAQLLRGQAMTSKRGGPQLRPVEPDDKDAICRLLSTGFKPTVPWKLLLEHPWQPEGMPRGFVLEADDRIVGFVGMICADREHNGRTGVVCNLSSWYVRPEYRGWSNALMAAATQFPITYTSLTASKTTRRVLRALGFSEFDGSKYYLSPLRPSLRKSRRSSLIFDPSVIRANIGDAQRQILDDHAGTHCLPSLLLSDSGMAFIVLRRRLYRGRLPLFPYSEVLYCSAPEVLNRHLERIKLSIMWRQKSLGLSISRHTSSSNGIKVPSQTLFRSETFAAHELDKMYSELALLPV